MDGWMDEKKVSSIARKDHHSVMCPPVCHLMILDHDRHCVQCRPTCLFVYATCSYLVINTPDSTAAII